MHFALIFILVNNVFSLGNDIDHAIYISVTKVKINTQDHEISISLKVFSDDFEDAIHNHSGKRERVVGRSDFKDLTEIVKQYVNKKTEIYLDGKKVNLEVDSCENIGDTTWIYLKVSIESSFIDTIRIKNQILFEVFDTQKNIVEVEYNDEKYYYSLTKDEPEAIIEF